MEYRNIIFDFDGTLADTSEVIVETMSRTMKSLNLPYRTEAKCRSMIGYRLEEIPAVLWPDISNLSERYVKTYRDVFSLIKDDFKIKLYPGVIDTLSLLQAGGINMAIASSRSRISLKEYTEELHIFKFFQLLIGGEDVSAGKPSAEPVEKILSIKGWEKTDTLVVGDMNVDILMGKGAGTATCGVTYGNGKEKELREAGADYIISDFSLLSQII